LQVGIVGDRLLDQRIERLRLEQPPPLKRNVAAFDEALPPAFRRVGGGRLRRQWFSGVAREFGRRRITEVGTDGATRQRHRGRQSGGTCSNPPDRYVQHMQLV